MTVDLPESVSEAEAKLPLAARLFAIGRLSCGQAAELAGYSKRTFMELRGKPGVPVLDYSAEELTDDLHNREYTHRRGELAHAWSASRRGGMQGWS